jgi:hypothetical protein
MKINKYTWIFGSFVILALLIGSIVLFLPKTPAHDDPWANVPTKLPHTPHTDLFKGPLEDGPSVTRACLECHNDAGQQVMSTAHWTWESEPVLLPGRTEPVTVGKKKFHQQFLHRHPIKLAPLHCLSRRVRLG